MTDTLTGRLVGDMPLEEYLTGPWLTHSRARKLLPPSCPARVRFDLDHPGEEQKPEFDQGKVVHLLVLGDVGRVTVIEAPDWRTKAAREQRDEAYAGGVIPVLSKDFEACTEMAASVLSHPLAGSLFSNGKPEQVILWTDRELGVERGSRMDWLPTPGHGRFIIGELKTCDSADAESVSKRGWDYGYASQAAWNIDAVRATGISDDPAVCVVFVEKREPYLVSVNFYTDRALAIGQLRNTEAIKTWVECIKTGRWPGHNQDEIAYVGLPAWIERQYEELI